MTWKKAVKVIYTLLTGMSFGVAREVGCSVAASGGIYFGLLISAVMWADTLAYGWRDGASDWASFKGRVVGS